MDNYPMHTGGVEQDRTCDVQGFDNVGGNVSNTSMPATAVAQSKPLSDSAIRTSDTQKIEVGPSASDITMRTR